MSLNQIQVMGRFVKTPELGRTKSGTAVTSFTLAVQRDFKDDNGEYLADFIPCVAWKNTAEFVSRYFQKGSLAVAAGRIQVRPWIDNAGNKRTIAEIVVSNIYFAESKNSTHSQVADSEEGNGPFEEFDDEDGDLPWMT